MWACIRLVFAQGYDIMEEMYSPKSAASNFLHELCESRQKNLDPFMQQVLIQAAAFVKVIFACNLSRQYRVPLQLSCQKRVAVDLGAV